ncbi:MAG: thioredoxin family protein [Comamonas sp.]
MTYQSQHLAQNPATQDVEALRGNAVLEFGTAWCGHCQGAQALIRDALAARDDVQHLKVEDGPGRPLGRNYRVKLWPTLIFLRDGQEVGRSVRPATSASLAAEMAKLPQD